MMKAPQEIFALVARFEQNLEAYQSGKYNETQIRREFIDPFFKVLGWDVENTAGYAEAYKDVIHEDAIKIGSVSNAPDYSFRIGGTRKFFVEAKKPSVNIAEDIGPAYQVRRYAWSAKLPLSILTDFEEFAVYDCRVKPDKSDKASTARIIYMNYKEYLTRWEEIASVFSKEAVMKGSFDKYAESAKAKKGTAGVDAAFLAEIDSWRQALAQNIALRNPKLSQRELNYSVGKTIDRIIFLRICEDRGIEPYGQLMALQNGANVYKRLTEIYYNADDKYNSGLFHFKQEKDRFEPPDDLTLSLSIDDKILKDIFKSLYYPESPYEFSVLPADILGQVYEQFLGKVIHLTPGHRAKVEEKPEVRKAGGVYYTPTYIVDYIVKNTVGKLLDGKTPKTAEKLRILDPACGSGSFLIGAYQYLLDWHRDIYVEDDPEKYTKGKNPALYQKIRNEWRLTTAERKRILLNNIYGVDIDPQAVEVTKLSLLLKVLEGESDQTIKSSFKLFHERALPDLGNNIKCGNSLIGPDYYEGKQTSFLDTEERERVNAFDWEKEFPEIFQAGGFDAVIGNPPYIRQEMIGDFKEYFQQHYKVYNGVADIYVYFIERGINFLNQNGFFSYIVANKWIRANYGMPLRKWLKDQNIEEIVDFGDLPVFQKATTYPCVIRVVKNKSKKELRVTSVKTLSFRDLESYVANQYFTINPLKLDSKGWSLTDSNTQELLEKIKKAGVSLAEYVKGNIYRGVLTGLNEAFVIDAGTKRKLIAEDKKSKELIKPFLLGRDIKRYQPPESNNFLIFTRRGINIKDYPAINRYLSQYKESLLPKPKDWKGAEWKGRKPGNYQWYEIQDAVDYYEEFEKPKIIYPNICKKPEFTLDHTGFYTNQKCFIISYSDKYLLGILNSSVSNFLFNLLLPKLRGDFFEPSYVYFKDFPIRTIKDNDSVDMLKYNLMIQLVEQMLSLNKQLAAAKTDHEKTLIQRQIDATDKQIDKLVYELYDLTPEEIAIVEGQ
ncbi:MAG: Eco57I restriction-modification methylase domain-containing protein [Syntrophaceae bacterium]|nr:Eco57I restriction-modification methylase domain-containing protein [Syntrophaceae bacterium]